MSIDWVHIFLWLHPLYASHQPSLEFRTLCLVFFFTFPILIVVVLGVICDAHVTAKCSYGKSLNGLNKCFKPMLILFSFTLILSLVVNLPSFCRVELFLGLDVYLLGKTDQIGLLFVRALASILTGHEYILCSSLLQYCFFDPAWEPTSSSLYSFLFLYFSTGGHFFTSLPFPVLNGFCSCLIQISCRRAFWTSPSLSMRNCCSYLLWIPCWELPQAYFPFLVSVEQSVWMQPLWDYFILEV